MSRYDLAGSLIPALVKYLQETRGDVLELGIGYNSTPLLHWICKNMGRNLVSLESDEKWTEQFNDYRSNKHQISTIKDWSKAEIDKNWGLVLVDNRPATSRRDLAKRLRNLADVILVHDSEPEINTYYGYERIYPLFKYRKDYTKFRPYTTVLSNFRRL